MASLPLICGNCGAPNAAHESFCSACGYSLMGGATATTVVPSSPAATPTGQLPATSLLNQRYRVLRTIGQGGMGAVYQAEDTLLGDRLVAVKEMSQGNLYGQQAQDSVNDFQREAHLLAGLQHPNLPSIHDYFEETGRWYLVMSFIQGETLADYLEHAQDHKLSLEETLGIGQTLCNVLDYLHTHQPPIIFRDLKPGNIMRSPDGHIYLIDFGIARHFKPGQAKDTASYGSMGYAPPEQYGKAQTTAQSDIYSLGATLYECLSGYDPSQSPFLLPSLQTLAPTLPEQLVTLITQMLEMDASKRPASVQVVEQEIQQASLPAANRQANSTPNGQTTWGQYKPTNSAPKQPPPVFASMQSTLSSARTQARQIQQQLHRTIQTQTPPITYNRPISAYNVRKQAPNTLLRTLYFLCIGWFLGLFLLEIGLILCMLVITLPQGIAVLNRLPQVMTLYPADDLPAFNMGASRTRQRNFLLRIIYFLYIGYWAGCTWACLASCFCILDATVPIGLEMIGQLPAVFTLHKR